MAEPIFEGKTARTDAAERGSALGDDELLRVAGGLLEEDMSKPCVNDVIRIKGPLYWSSCGGKKFSEHYEGKERVMRIEEGSFAPYCVLTHLSRYWTEEARRDVRLARASA